MPNTPADRILAAGIAIAELFRTGELNIIALLAAVCGKGNKRPERAIQRLKQKNTRNRFAAALNKILEELQEKAYHEALRRLTEMYETTAKQVEALSEYIEGDLTRTAESAQKAVQDLLDDLNAQWLESLKNMRRKADDVYRHVIELEQANADAAGDDLRKAVEEALQSFAEKGVTGFTDRANRNWGLAEYSEMAMRTAMQRANLLATIDSMLRTGQDLCYVNQHMGSCPVCMHWESVIISLTGRTPGYMTLRQAMDAGLFHPNCAHILQVYIPGVSRLDIGRPEDISNLENRKLYLKRQQQRYLERNVRKWKKKQAAATAPEYERYCMHQVEYWQGRIRKHIKDNPELPRRYDREGGKVVLSELAKAKTEGGGAPKAPRDATWKRLITTPEQAAAIENLQTTAESAIIAPSTKVDGGGVNKIGKIKKTIFAGIVPNITSDSVIITDERIAHVNIRHPGDWDNYGKFVADTISNPDFVLADKNPNTAICIKKVNVNDEIKHLRTTLRLRGPDDEEGFDNSILTFQKINLKEYGRLSRNKNVVYKKE